MIFFCRPFNNNKNYNNSRTVVLRHVGIERDNAAVRRERCVAGRSRGGRGPGTPGGGPSGRVRGLHAAPGPRAAVPVGVGPPERPRTVGRLPDGRPRLVGRGPVPRAPWTIAVRLVDADGHAVAVADPAAGRHRRGWHSGRAPVLRRSVLRGR